MQKTAMGAFLLTSALLAFALQDAIVKFLSAEFAVLQILTIRIAFVLLILLVICRLKYGFGNLKTDHTAILFLRGLLAFLAFTSYYLAMAVIPMASVSAVYMSAPLFVTAMSAIFLRESVGLHRWLSVFVGFAAVLLIVNPSADTFRIEAMLPILSALFYSLLPIITRRIGEQVNAVTMSIYNAFSYFVICLAVAALLSLVSTTADSPPLLLSITQNWPMPSLIDMSLLALSGILFTVGVLCITQAYRIAHVSAIAPFEYSLLIWTMLVGFVVFGEIPSMRTIAGGFVIFACGVYILYRESKARVSDQTWHKESTK